MACKKGYYGPFCNSSCPSGTYGYRCAGVCVPMCSLSECDHVNGCSQITSEVPTLKPACKPGYYGQSCDTPCPNGTFGNLCAGVCAPMCSVTECDTIKGCPQITAMNTETSTRGYQFTRNNTSARIHIPSKENNAESTKIEFNTAYLLIGIGFLSSLVLFLSLKVLYMKCKSVRRKKVSKQEFGGHNMHGEEDENTHGDQNSYASISGKSKNCAYHRPLTCEYSEIVDEEMHVPVNSVPKKTTETSPTDLPLEHGKIAAIYQREDSSVEILLEKTYTCLKKSDLYISPTFNKEAKES